MDTISTGKYIELAYKIYSVDKDGNRSLEYEFTEQVPDHFVYGAEPGLLEDFSRKLQGLSKGDEFKFTLNPEQAFGPRNEDLVMDLERSIFNDSDGNFMADMVQVGRVLTMMTSTGQPAQGLVTNVGDEKVTMDFNHRLAVKNVEYDGHVLLVRDATPDALQHHHGGCGGCSCDSCGGGCGDHHDHDSCGCGGCH